MFTLSEALVTERKKKEIALDRISQTTNININFLRALENGNLADLPGKFYLIRFIKSYLNALEIEEGDFLEKFASEINSVKFKGERNYRLFYSKLKYSRFRKRNLVLSILGGLILFILLFYLLAIFNGDIAALFGFKSGPTNLPGTGMIVNPKLANFFSYDFSPVNVDFKFLRDCWLSVYRSGEKYFERIFKKGERKTVKGYELVITFGDPSAVRFYVNGTEISSYQKTSSPVKIRLNPSNLNKLSSND